MWSDPDPDTDRGEAARRREGGNRSEESLPNLEHGERYLSFAALCLPPRLVPRLVPTVTVSEEIRI